MKKSSAIALVMAIGTGIWSPAARTEDVLDILSAKDSAPVQAVQNLDSRLITELSSEIGKSSPEQNIFLEFVRAGQLEKALYQWGSAFKGHSFPQTETGKALYGFLLFRAGLTVTGVEQLFQARTPEKIAKSVQAMWREVATPNHAVWGLAQLNWTNAWTNIFDLATEVKVRGRGFSSVNQMEPMIELLKKTVADSPERAWLQWQVTLGTALGGDVSQAAKILKNLMEAKGAAVGVDHMNITAARLLYQSGFLDAAIQYYEKVPKNSDFWLEAQEEMGWAFIRKGEPQNALAKTMSLMAPVFTDQVGPESVFLHALGQLKICDYPGVAKSLTTFRERFRPKAQVLVDLAKTGVSADSEVLVQKLKVGRTSTEDLGAAAKRLPRLSVRDQLLAGYAQSQKQLEEEARMAAELYARSLTGGTDQVGFQASILELKKQVDSRVQTAKSASFGRVQQLAQSELKEFELILQKLHIVEAELIQQISQAERVIAATDGQSKTKPEAKVGTTGSTAQDRMIFPFQGEVWFDELANYRITVKKGCQASGQKSKGAM